MDENVDINDMGLDPSGNAYGTDTNPDVPADVGDVVDAAIEAGGYLADQAEAIADGPPMMLLLFILVLAAFLGFELINRVPSTLHTPLMSGSNAISGITITGAILVLQAGRLDTFGIVLGVAAVTFATINVVGGYLVTDRMLAMFKKKGGAS